MEHYQLMGFHFAFYNEMRGYLTMRQFKETSHNDFKKIGTMVMFVTFLIN